MKHQIPFPSRSQCLLCHISSLMETDLPAGLSKVKEPLPPHVPGPWWMQVWNMYDNSEQEDVRGIKPFRIRMSSRWKNWFFCTLSANVVFVKWSDLPKYSTWHSAVLWLGSEHLCVQKSSSAGQQMHIGQHVPISLVFPNSWDISFWFCPTVSQQLLVSGRNHCNSCKWPTWRTIVLFHNTFITVLYTFRAASCSSSGGQIVQIQHLV